MTGNAFLRERQRPHLLIAGVGRHRNTATQLAVDLNHQFDPVARQRGFVRPWPGRVENVSELLAVSQAGPQLRGDVRNDRVEHTQQDTYGLIEHLHPLVLLSLSSRRSLQHVEQLHARRHDRIELLASVIVVDLLQQPVRLGPQVTQRRIVNGDDRHGRDMPDKRLLPVTKTPKPA
jgi:hypothetical protein